MDVSKGWPQVPNYRTAAGIAQPLSRLARVGHGAPVEAGQLVVTGAAGHCKSAGGPTSIWARPKP
jgi:hypothetical protein